MRTVCRNPPCRTTRSPHCDNAFSDDFSWRAMDGSGGAGRKPNLTLPAQTPLHAGQVRIRCGMPAHTPHKLGPGAQYPMECNKIFDPTSWFYPNLQVLPQQPRALPPLNSTAASSSSRRGRQGTASLSDPQTQLPAELESHLRLVPEEFCEDSKEGGNKTTEASAAPNRWIL